MQIECENETERRLALTRLIGVEDRVFLRIGEEPALYAIADEDLQRDNSEKTSAVHFLCFKLTDSMKAALQAGASMQLGCDHPAYRVQPCSVDETVRKSLAGDL